MGMGEVLRSDNGERANQITIKNVIDALLEVPKLPAKYVGNLPKGITEAVRSADGYLIHLYLSDNIDYKIFEETAKSLGYKTEITKKKYEPFAYYDQDGNKLKGEEPQEYETLDFYKEEVKEIKKHIFGKPERKEVKRIVESLVYHATGRNDLTISTYSNDLPSGKIKNRLREKLNEVVNLWEEYRKRKYGI